MFVGGEELREDLPPFNGRTLRFLLPDRGEDCDGWFRAIHEKIIKGGPGKSTVGIIEPMRLVHELPEDPTARRGALCILAGCDPESGIPLDAVA